MSTFVFRIPAIVSMGILTLSALCGAAQAETMGVMSKDSMSFAAAPAAMPQGAQFSTLYGDPGKGGPFIIRIKLPKGYKVPPHKHGAAEMLTVMSGEVRYGVGQQFDPAVEKFAHAGDFIVTPAETGHWVVANDDTVLQLDSVGPFNIMYLDPRDDPRTAHR